MNEQVYTHTHSQLELDHVQYAYYNISYLTLSQEYIFSVGLSSATNPALCYSHHAAHIPVNLLFQLLLYAELIAQCAAYSGCV